MPVAFRDYYEALGVSRDASTDEIRRAYRTLARQYHPDVNKDPEAADRFREISEAYEVLRDPEKRAQYDRFGTNRRAGDDVSGTAGFDDFAGGTRFEDFRVDFGNGSAFGGFSDFFDGLFGESGRRAGPADEFAGFSRRGGDLEAELELSLEEAARGGRRSVRLGDGRSYEVDVPPGVSDGQRIRLAGEGRQGTGGGPDGDLFLRVRVRPHSRFRRQGNDLYVDLRVAPWEAALGARIDLRTLDGQAAVRVPAGSSCGRRLRLRGEGVPRPDGTRGDLYAEVKIVVPPKLTEQEREAFEELARSSTFDPRKRR
jgi:curved DNA-binding protein